MARYLAYTSPARGHLYPIVATLLELHGRGHDVHVRTLSSEVPALRAAGLLAAGVARAIENLPLDDWQAASFEDALAGGLRTFGARATHEVPDLERAIAQVDPDVLLVDITTVGAAALADSWSLPWAQSIPFFQHIFPFTLNDAGIAVLNAPRRELGLPLVTGPSDVWRAPLYLSYTAPPFQPANADLPPSFALVGPGLWEPPAEDWAGLEDLDQPLVLVAISSEYQGDHVLVETALEALAGEDVRVLVSTAAHDPARFEAPPNARVARWLPHARVVPNAACVVCHGGMGITQKALAAGVPVCVVPFGRDQFEVAERVVRVGGGTRVLPSDLDPTTLRAAVRDTIAMRDGARRVAAGFARAGGASAAADRMESLLSTPVRAGHDMVGRGAQR